MNVCTPSDIFIFSNRAIVSEDTCQTHDPQTLLRAINIHAEMNTKGTKGHVKNEGHKPTCCHQYSLSQSKINGIYAHRTRVTEHRL